MKRSLEIYNFGPIKEVKMDFARFNVIIGPQSAGKSCILKIACHCAWAEKRLMVSRDVTLFQKDNFFFTQLLSFHKLEGYDSSPDLKIVYRTTFLTITYTHRDRQFACRFTSQRRLYKRSKLSYIPAERNVVSTIPNWMELSYADTNTRSFMSDWVEARKGYTDKHLPILDLGAEYFYDKTSQTDMVACEGVEKPLPMSNVSSGLQSVIPLALYIHYLTGDVFADKAASVARQRDNEALMYSLYDDFYKNGIPAVHPKCEANIGGKFLSFASASDRDAFLKRYNNFTSYQQSDIFVEEPEENLFAATQAQVVYRLISRTFDPLHDNSIFIATHSPYILYALNNCILANIVRSKAPADELVAMPCAATVFSPKDVAVWQIDDGCLVQWPGSASGTVQDEKGLIRANFFDDVMRSVMLDFNALLSLK